MSLTEDYFKALNDKIDNLPTKDEAEAFVQDELVALGDMATGVVNKVTPTIEEELNKINPYVEQVQGVVDSITGLSVSLSPDSILAAITTAVAQPLKQYHIKIQTMMREMKPPTDMYITMTETVGEIATNVGSLQEHLQAKLQEKEWDIPVPEIPIPEVPDIPLLESLPSALSSADQALSTITGLPPVEIGD